MDTAHSFMLDREAKIKDIRGMAKLAAHDDSDYVFRIGIAEPK
jgi:hypothetical protein